MTVEAIVLAHCAPFNLGHIRVDPPQRRITNGKASMIVEPRVLEVLVALATARGNVLSRDDLISMAWNGNVVGDNAIHRAISRVRQIATAFGDEAYSVETVRGVGYRLKLAAGEEADDRVTEIGSPSGPLSRRVTLGAFAGAAVATVLFVVPRTRADKLQGEARDLFERAEVARKDQDGQISPQHAVALYRSTIELVPTYAPAWAGLALAYCQQLDQERDERTYNIGRLASSAASTSIKLDDDTILGRLAGILARPAFGRWNEVQTELSRLAERGSTWEVPANMAILSSQVGAIGDALQHGQRAMAREPLNSRLYGDMFYRHWIAGEIHEAERLLDEAASRWPRSYFLWSTTFLYLVTSGRTREAMGFLDLVDRLPMNLSPNAVSSRRAFAALIEGDEVSRKDLREKYLSDASKSNWAIRNSAIMLAVMGERDPMYSMLHGFFRGIGPFPRTLNAYSRRPSDWLYMPFFNPYRREKRFTHLLRSFNLDPEPRL